jgi:hypothetical protein
MELIGNIINAVHLNLHVEINFILNCMAGYFIIAHRIISIVQIIFGIVYRLHNDLPE